MKRLLCLLLAVVMAVCLFAGCNSENASEDGKLSVVTTIFPFYDLIHEVMGDNVDNAKITMLLDNGVDLHSYQPTASDIVTISNSDLFVYTGGESDKWVEDLLKDKKNKDLKTLNLMEALGEDFLHTEETVEGMEDTEEEDEGEEEGEEYDEHIWLSIRNAQKIVENISDRLSEVDSENADSYKSNANKYNEKLGELKDKYSEAVSLGAKKTILFADRFPFRYLTDEFGLKYFAAFKGCSAESEASFETISFLANKINELNLNSVAVLDGSKAKIANTVIKTSKRENVKTITFNSMQTTTSKDVEAGQTYYSIMEDNLNSLKEALS